MSKADAAKPHFSAVTPRLPVADMNEALAFYIETLGFQLGWTWGDPISHANVCRDSISLDLVLTPSAQAGTAMAYIEVRAIDAYFAELKGRAFPADEPQDRPYGMRDFEIVDRDGNSIMFGAPTAG